MGQNQEQKEIISKIIEAASHINKVTRSGTGDHIIVSSEFANLMDEQIMLLKSLEVDSKIEKLLKNS
jgi:precorrin-4 methylase